MKVAYLTPDGQYEFFRQLPPALGARGIKVAVNDLPPDCDLALAAILPATPDWLGPLRAWGGPFVLWHWDRYSFVDLAQPRWAEFLALLPLAAQVWSCCHEVARQLKEAEGLDSEVVPAWVEPNELDAAVRASSPRSEALYAVSGQGFGKRADWAEHACSLAGLPLRVLRGQSLPRAEYLRAVASCRVYLMTAFEESNGTVPALEAAACGRPLVLADLPASREAFGPPGTPGVYYFDVWDFGGLLAQLRRAWADGGRDFPGLRRRVRRLFGLGAVADAAANRLRGLHARLQAGAG